MLCHSYVQGHTQYMTSNYLWVWSGPAVCQRPALWSPSCQWWHLQWWRGSRCTVSLRCHLPPTPQTGRTQPNIKETLTPPLVLCCTVQQVQKTREIKSMRNFEIHQLLSRQLLLWTDRQCK